MKYEIIKDIKYTDFIRIRKLIKWNELDENQIKIALKNSMINISIFYNNMCIGVGRIVGDNVLKGMLTDIMVDPNYQGMGIGKLIVTSLINEVENRINIGNCFQLEASPTANNREFYIKCGMKYKPENQDGVYLWIRK
jgi:GNAT superfamily N-acetyltransferase